jgi:hypothetical protein
VTPDGDVAAGPAAGGPAVPAAPATPAEAIAAVLSDGIALLDEGRITAALDLCTPTFRAVIEGTMSGASGATVATEVGRGDAVAAAARLTAKLAIRLQIENVSVVVDRDTAYGTAIVTATAVLAGTGRPVTRRYACTARCVRTGGRWLVDFVTAGEGG